MFPLILILFSFHSQRTNLTHLDKGCAPVFLEQSPTRGSIRWRYYHYIIITSTCSVLWVLKRLRRHIRQRSFHLSQCAQNRSGKLCVTQFSPMHIILLTDNICSGVWPQGQVTSTFEDFPNTDFCLVVKKSFFIERLKLSHYKTVDCEHEYMELNLSLH